MTGLPFRIKICGVTNVDDAQMAARAGADAIGLNFYHKSARYVDLARAQAIAASIPPGVTKVGVFVNSTAQEIRDICSAVGLDLIQLHGDEPTEVIADLSGLPTVRALRWGSNAGAAFDRFLNRCVQLKCMPSALLIDAHHPTEYGGTGITADWSAICQWSLKSTFDIPMILAGGLTPANVAQAIAAVRPAAVDTASGVESSPGRKDAQRMEDFVRASKQAFTSL